MKYTFSYPLHFKSESDVREYLEFSGYIISNFEIDSNRIVTVEISNPDDKLGFNLSWFDNPEYL